MWHLSWAFSALCITVKKHPGAVMVAFKHFKAV
jgi:hypothetical protein